MFFGRVPRKTSLIEGGKGGKGSEPILGGVRGLRGVRGSATLNPFVMIRVEFLTQLRTQHVF